MAVPRLALLHSLLVSLAVASLPAAQAGPLDPEPHECGGLGVDSGCTHWVCHDDGPGGCRFGCPGSEGCELVECDYYVGTPVLLACFHDDPATTALRCLTETLDVACLVG